MTTNLSSVGVIGSGAMGSGIAQVAASYGYSVFLIDSNPQALKNAKKNLAQSLSKLLEKQKITSDKAEEITNNIKFETNLEALNPVNIAIEAIVENLEIKQSLFSKLESIVSENCILASNTSSLSITSIASACKKSDRVIGIHFFNPATIMPLVEIIPGLSTNPSIVSQAKSIIDSWQKSTVIAKDTPGFIVNRIARPFYGEAIRMYEEGIADFATIDWAMKEIGGFKMGPFELMDLIGNDVNYTVTETVWKQFFYDPRYKPSLTQKRLFEAKHFGRKTGVGYYNYTNSSNSSQPKKDSKLGNEIFIRIVAMLINEAIDALYLNIASKEDIDTAITKGVNYPKGLLKWGDEIGLNTVLTTLTDLYNLYLEDRYRPSVLLRKMAATNELFYKK